MTRKLLLTFTTGYRTYQETASTEAFALQPQIAQDRQALLEQSETDLATGRFLNRNYSGYLVPTNADIPDLDILFVGEFDEEASPLGAKGLGELTAVSVAPAIANAIYHATGKRVRDLPITVEKLL